MPGLTGLVRRTPLQAAVVVATLALAGCGGGGDDSANARPSSGKGTPSPVATSAPGSPTPSAGASGTPTGTPEPGGTESAGASERPGGGGRTASPTSGSAPSASPSDRATTSAPGRAPQPSRKPAEAGGRAVEGSWVGTTEGRPVSLTVKQGRAVVLAEAHVCQGTAEGPATSLTLRLTCDSDYTARTEGTARAKGGKITVEWQGGVKDKLTEAAAPKE
ncbi:hypothetical protein [Streptomyces lichenis]|uniref:Lipoprotein n=1 Tax=Streptomyces lichenis TaxID=2306967 RepID=A0ABT0I998_9ACTN|nr:hypothetical protein [Streptomyces lichenis]MCK8677901.1 hypothetical protein [Streptomyces lichenis]